VSEGQDYRGHRKRLRERFLKSGVSGFQDYELLELLLTYVIPRKDTKPCAKALLRRFGSPGGVLDADISELLEVKGIGREAALFIKVMRGFITEYQREKGLKRRKFQSPPDVAEYLRIEMGGLRDEQFRCLFLNSQNELIAEEVIQDGTVDQAVVYPRKVLEAGLRHKASGVILAHNHPGGSLRPSRNDIDLTQRIRNAAREIGLKVHDHIVVTKSGYLSMYEEGLLS
jgi:DNA repair protein RadC